MTLLSSLLTRTRAELTKPGPAMRRTIATAHAAATYAAIKERTGVMPKGLSKAERTDLKAAVAAQLKYYDAFAAQAGEMSDAAIAARAGMYAGSIRGTFNNARYPGLSQVPGDGQTACKTNCGCFLTEGEGGIHWHLDEALENCEDCQAMAAGGPYGT